jgi:phenylacetate-CoA ligase
MIFPFRPQAYRAHWAVRSRLEPLGLAEALRRLEQSERWPRERLDELRDGKLRRLVAHFYEASSFYRALMEEARVRPPDIRGAADLAKLPILTKEIVREQKDALRVRQITDAQIEVGVTGGTTGEPMRFVRDREGSVWQRGCYWRGFGWGGLRLGEPWVQIFGGALGLSQRSAKDRFKNWFAGKLFLPAFELGSHNVGEYVAAIRKSRARFLVGYASSCYLLARHVESAGETLSLDAVFPTAELLPEEWALTIRHAFGAKVLPYYGCGEVQSLAYSCPDSSQPAYHTCDEHSIIEVERPDGTAALVGEGAFLLTDLDNHSMPFLRYRNGDAGVLAGPSCSCGRALGRIARLDGRVNDMLVTTAGDAISGVIGTHAFRSIGNVEHFQILQRRPGHACIRVVRSTGYDPSIEEPRLRGIFSSHLGAAAEIEIEYSNEIPRTAAGKSRLVINEYLEARNSRTRLQLRL